MSVQKYKVGIFGSSEDNSKELIEKARYLGSILGKHKLILITGASTGIPYEVVLSAKSDKTEIWGFSQATDLDKQKNLSPELDFSIYSRIFYIPKDYEFASSYEVCRKYRNVSSTANCDAGIIISGRWGTLNEFTNLYEMGKVIGVLTGTGGIADELPMLYKKITKKSKAIVIFENSPTELVKKMLNELKQRK